MAVTYTNITDGQSVTTWATNANTFGNAVKANIDTIETNVALLGTSKISVGDTGMIYTVTTTGASHSLTTTYQKVVMTNAISLDKSNGHISINTTTGVTTFITAGVYSINFAGAIGADNGDDISFNYNLNGVSIMSNPPVFSGRGLTTPTAISNSVFIEVTAGSTIYVEAKSNVTSTMIPIGCGVSVEKTYH